LTIPVRNNLAEVRDGFAPGLQGQHLNGSREPLQHGPVERIATADQIR
jgi:hypothetical protein